MAVLQVVQHIQARPGRQRQVQQDHVRGPLLGEAQDVLAVARRQHGAAGALERIRHGGTERQVVLHDQQRLPSLCSHVHAPVLRPSSGGAASSSRTVKVLPTPSWLSTPMLPPCCSTIWWAPVRPMPMPAMRPTTLLPRWNRSKMCACSPSGIPMPRSRTCRTAQAPSASSCRAIVTVICPPLGLYLTAFASRLLSTRRRRAAS